MGGCKGRGVGMLRKRPHTPQGSSAAAVAQVLGVATYTWLVHRRAADAIGWMPKMVGQWLRPCRCPLSGIKASFAAKAHTFGTASNSSSAIRRGKR